MPLRQSIGISAALFDGLEHPSASHKAEPEKSVFPRGPPPQKLSLAGEAPFKPTNFLFS